MASSTSSGSISSLGEEDLQAVMDQRKRKRMISNRESARRSRMRKQKHLDDLTAQLAHLRSENHQILTRVTVTTQYYVGLEAENSVLRAQAGELSHRLQSLDEIVSFLGANNGHGPGPDSGPGFGSGFGFNGLGSEPFDSFLMNPLNLSCLNQPIMASADVFQY